MNGLHAKYPEDCSPSDLVKKHYLKDAWFWYWVIIGMFNLFVAVLRSFEMNLFSLINYVMFCVCLFGMKTRRDFSMRFDSMEFDVESLRKCLESYDIHPRFDTGDCIQMKDDSGQCHLECPYISECKFFSGMCVDMVGSIVAPKKFPDGFGVHLMNSIELYKAGIDVGIVEIKPEEYEDISERH